MAMPATACPALQHPAVSPNIDESGKQSLYPDGDLDRHQNLTSCSFVHCQLSLKFHAYLFGSFCAKLLINRQSNNDENISSLAEIMNYIFHDKMNTLAGLCSILYKEEPKEISRWPIQTTPVHLPWFWSTRDWYRHLKDFIDSVSWSADILQSLNGVWHLSSNWDGGTRSASLELLAANYSKNISHWMCQWLVNSEFL